MADYTTTELLASVRQRAQIPTSQTTFTDAKLLRIATEEMRSMLVPFIMSVREEYFVTYKDYTITASQSAYRIPERAIGGKLRDAVMVDSSGTIYELTRIPSQRRANSNTGTPNSFYIEGNYVCLYPTPAVTVNTLRLYYYQRPGELIATSAAAACTGLSSTVVTSGAVPSTMSTSTPLDFIRNGPGFETLAIDKTPSGKTGTTLTFAASTIPSEFAVGDYVCLAGQSPIPQIPYELHTILYQRTAIKVLEAIGDDAGLKRAREQLKEMENYQVQLISNRVDTKPKVIFGEE